MITSDDVFDRLAAANPQPDISDLVPTPSQFAEFLRDLEEAPVHTITKPPEPDRKTTRGGLLVAAAAFAIAILIGGVWLIAAREPAEPPTDIQPTTTASQTTTTEIEAEAPLVSEASQAVLDAFVRSYNEADIASYMALMHPDLFVVAGDRGGRPSPNGAHIGGTAFRRDLATYRQRIEWEMTVGTTVELANCEGDARVTCVATYHDFLSDAILGGDTVRIELGLDEGLVVEFTETAINGANFDSFLSGIRTWVDREYGIDLDQNDVVIEDPLDWSVYGRLYLASINMPVPEMPFAPTLSPEEMRLVIESLRWLEGGGHTDMATIWPGPALRFHVSGDAIDLEGSQVETWAKWLDAIETELRIVSCETVSLAEVECVVTMHDDLRDALSPNGDEWSTLWYFGVRDGVVVDLGIFDDGRDDYIAAVAAFAEWAGLRDEPVVIEIDSVTGDFAPSESNVAAYKALIDEYLRTLGG